MSSPSEYFNRCKCYINALIVLYCIIVYMWHMFHFPYPRCICALSYYCHWSKSKTHEVYLKKPEHTIRLRKKVHVRMFTFVCTDRSSGTSFVIPKTKEKYPFYNVVIFYNRKVSDCCQPRNSFTDTSVIVLLRSMCFIFDASCE